MNCNSCLTPITAEQAVVECDVCSKPIHKDCAINKDKVYCDVCYLSKTEEEIVPVFEGEVPDVIRRSHIQAYLDCPFKFYNEVILGHPQPPNIYAQIGVDLHDMFDSASNNRQYYKHHMLKDYHEAFDAYPEVLFNSIIGNATKEDMLQRGLDSIDTFYHILEALPFQPYQTEQTIIFDIGDELPKVQATSDRVDLIDGEL